MTLNRYCQECIKFTQGECEGRQVIAGNRKTIEWGQSLNKFRPSGLKFCRRYELDGSLCGDSNNEEVETFEDVRIRGQKRAERFVDQEMADDVDFGESLTSADFETFDLPV